MVVVCFSLQVAAYDFLLPVLVNGLKPSSPPPSPWPPSAKQTSKIAITQGSKGMEASQQCSNAVLSTYMYMYMYSRFDTLSTLCKGVYMYVCVW